MKRSGFTLIELLIVVAIIGILAAIAIPNFLEAQTRAKVVSVRHNFTTLATGLETYCIDHDLYVLAMDDVNWRHPTERLVTLTTPIAYLKDFPYDEFESNPGSWDNWGGCYWYEDRWSTSDWKDRTYWQTVLPELHATSNVEYTIISKGPDRADSYWYNRDGSLSTHLTEYDPSNGTVSWGDLRYWGPGNLDPGRTQNY